MSFSATALDQLSQKLAADSGSIGLDSARSRSQRRAQGAYFTPMPLVEYLVEEALDAWFASQKNPWHPEGHPNIRVLDPAAGDGRFLVATALSLFRRATAARPCSKAESDELKEAIAAHCLVAIERDSQYAAHVQEALGASAKIHCAEALLSGAVADGSIDVVVGNPPYLRSIHLGQVDADLREKLRGAYAATSYREWDLYAAFLEQGLRWLAPGGQLAFVVPSRWWTAQWAKPMRQELCEQASVRALVDFGATQLFPNATVYSSLCFASRNTSRNVELARHSDGQWHTGSVPVSKLGLGEPWNLRVGPTGQLLARLSAQGPSLGEVARIAKGAGTNADAVFVIAEGGPKVEMDLLRPLLRGRDVAAYGAVPSWPKVLVPYDSDGVLIAPQQMQAVYPKAYAYLCAHRGTLESREKGRFAGPTFYCYGRPQNMAFHSQHTAKLVVPDVTKSGRALIDRECAMVLDSAYAIRRKGESGYSLECLCAILNSGIVRLWFSQHGLPLRGGYTRMKTAYLKKLPLPPMGPKLDALSAAIDAGAEAEKLEEKVLRAYGVSAAF